MNIVSMFGEYLSATIERSIKEAVSPLAPYLRKLAMGAVFIAIGIISLWIVLIALAAAVFLGFAGLAYWAAALWTALVFGGFGLVVMALGFGSMKKPR
jgi:fatty acid desaturase